MLKWLHHLFNPHCPECMADRECKGCEILQRQLEVANATNQLLINQIKGTPTPVAEEPEQQELKPIKTTHRRFMPYAVRQQLINKEDERALELMKDAYNKAHQENIEEPPDTKAKEIELLERDVLGGR